MSWTLKTQTGTELAKVLNFTPALDRVKLLSRLYDGSYLAQTVGTPAQRPTSTILVDSMTALRAVNAAEASCALLELSYGGVIYTGLIAETPKWTPVILGSVYTAVISFAVQTEAAET